MEKKNTFLNFILLHVKTVINLKKIVNLFFCFFKFSSVLWFTFSIFQKRFLRAWFQSYQFTKHTYLKLISFSFWWCNLFWKIQILTPSINIQLQIISCLPKIFFSILKVIKQWYFNTIFLKHLDSLDLYHL